MGLLRNGAEVRTLFDEDNGHFGNFLEWLIYPDFANKINENNLEKSIIFCNTILAQKKTKISTKILI